MQASTKLSQQSYYRERALVVRRLSADQPASCTRRCAATWDRGWRHSGFLRGPWRPRRSGRGAGGL